MSGVGLLRLQNFRNYAEAEFAPGAGTTVVYGSNGSGKSSLLEAAGLFATLSSSRAGSLGFLVRLGCSEGGAHLETRSGSVLEVRLRGARSLLRAGGSSTVARNFLGRFRAVLFTPEDLDLVRGEPELRRRALDDLIVQLRPAYRGVKQEYDRALRQRNAALRQGLGAEAAIYNAPLAAAAAQVLDARRGIVTELTPYALTLYDELAGRGRLGLRYKDTSGAGEATGEALAGYMLRRYEEDLAVEIERGTTRCGPHRDDLEIEIDGSAARSFASRGEQRSAALSFRLAELRLLPGAVLLLDDVLSELDADRRLRLFGTVGAAQTIVTTTDRGSVPSGADVEQAWSVSSGELRRVG